MEQHEINHPQSPVKLFHGLLACILKDDGRTTKYEGMIPTSPSDTNICLTPLLYSCVEALELYAIWFQSNKRLLYKHIEQALIKPLSVFVPIPNLPAYDQPKHTSMCWL